MLRSSLRRVAPGTDERSQHRLRLGEILDRRQYIDHRADPEIVGKATVREVT